MTKLRFSLVIAVVGLGATSLFAHDRAVLLPQPGNQAPAAVWVSSNLDRAPEGLAATATPARRVVVSGYHPLTGFEAETAAERAAIGGGTPSVPRDQALR